MKKTLIIVLLLSGIITLPAAVEIRIGGSYGGRTMNSAKIKDVYGNGGVYSLFSGVNIYKGFGAGLGYEGGYNREGKIGMYNEATQLKLSGFELFISYQRTFAKFTPYVRLGYGSFSYKQTVETPYAQKVDATEGTVCLTGGAHFSLIKGLFVSAELKYIPLNVKPFTEAVDLGGLRYSIGLGYLFKL